MMPPFDVTFYS